MKQGRGGRVNDSCLASANGLETTPTGELQIRQPVASGATIQLSLIIPTYNESKNLGKLVGRLSSLLDPVLGSAYELIVVDDDSPDRTWESALALAREHPKLRVLRRVGERGLSTAVIRGWQLANGDVLGVIDADLQHPPEAVLKLWSRMHAGADLAVASRHVEGGGVSNWSAARRILSRGAQLLGLLILPSVVGRVSDPMSGYFMVRRVALRGASLQPLGYKILLEVLGRGRIREVAEVPYVFQERVEGESKVSSRLYVDYLRHLLRLRLADLPIERFLRFATVGVSGVIVDMTLFFLLSDPHMLGYGLTRSKLLAAEVAIINNFIWNDVWTFGDVSAKQSSALGRLRRFAKFQAICLAGLLINAVLLNIFFNSLHVNRYVANAMAIGLVTLWNFWLNLKLGWRVTASTSNVSPDEFAVIGPPDLIERAE
jgi:dolichol-phosphate mannosyltransferase